MAVQLTINSDAHMEGIEKANKALREMEMAGMSANKIFKGSGNLASYNAALERVYHTTGFTKTQTAASTAALNTYVKALSTAQQRIGSGKFFGFEEMMQSEEGMVPVTRLTKDFGVVESHLKSFMQGVLMDTENFSKAVEHNMAFSLKDFNSNMQENARVTGIFGSQLDVLRQKMSTLQGEIESQSLIGGNADDIDAMKAQWVTLAEQEQKLLASFDSDDFYDGVEKRGKAVKMFGTELDSVQTRMSMIRQKGIALDELGGDPEQIKKLSERYQELSAEHTRLSQAANGTGSRIKHLIKNFVSAQLIVWAIRKTMQLFTQGIREASQAAAQAEQVATRFITVFDRIPAATAAVVDLVSNYGLAATSAKTVLATIGDMASGLGATDQELGDFSNLLAGRIQDLIAYKDIEGDVVEITQGLMSGIAGNTRNFRQYGSIVKEATVQANLHEKGLDKLTGTSLEWAKAQERANIFLEQQENSVGAVRREWDQLLTVNRRYEQQMISLKESLGETLNTVITPMKTWILGIAESWNIALAAATAYRNGVKPTFIASPQTDKLIKQDFTAVDFLGFNPSGKKNVTADYFKDVVSFYGAPWEYVVNLIDGYATFADGALREIYEFYTKADIMEATEMARREHGRKKFAAMQFYSDQIKEREDTFMGYGALGFSTQGASAFIPEYGLSAILGYSDDDLKTKSDALVEIAKETNNKIIKENEKGVNKNSTLITIWTSDLTTLEKEIRKVNSEINVQTVQKSLFTQIAALKKRNEYEAQYGKDNKDVVDRLVEQFEREQELLTLKNEKKISEDDYLDSMKLVTEYYKLQLDYAQQLEAINRSEKIAEFVKGTSEMASSNAAARYNLTARSPFDSTARTAGIDREIARFENKVSLQKFADDLFTSLGGDVGDMTGKQMQEYLDAVNNRRLQMELDAETKYQQSLKDAHDESLQTIKEAWDSLGDVGMIRDWIDTFKTSKAYSESQGMSTDEASDIAKTETLWAIVAEFASKLESVNKILGIVTEFMERIAPAWDQFLAPIVELIKPLVSILGDLMLPVLQILFPLIQGLAVAFVFLFAVVKTVSNAFSWLVDTITTAIWNIAHPFRQRSFRDLGDETVAIWEEANATVEEIWAMEIDTRLDFIGELTEAQKGQLDAYNEMFASGLLTLTQYQAMVGSNVYGQNYDNVDIESFAAGGDFVTNGERIIRVGEAGSERVTITPLNSTKYANRGNMTISNASYSVTVNGANADPEQIAESVRREFKRMDRRGVKYA